MKRKTYYCNECEAEFVIKYEMDKQRYIVQYCPFCGELWTEMENEGDEENENESENG